MTAVCAPLHAARLRQLHSGTASYRKTSLGPRAGAAWAESLNPGLYNTAGGAANSINRALFPGTGVWTAFGAEWLATSILIWAVLASGDVGRVRPGMPKRSAAMNPLAIG